VRTVAGHPKQKGFKDGVGSAAIFRYPRGIAVNRTSGVLYVADTGNHRIKAISPDGNFQVFPEFQLNQMKTQGK
jgi:DNA-binding beta-propeller fold protein YncE